MKIRHLLLATAATVAMGVSAAQAEIVIATAGPMTGQYASFGEQMQRGAEMAVKDINAAGGVLGQQLVLEIGDDACDPKQAVAVANQLVNRGAVFVAGHFCSGSSIPASQVYDEEGIIQISPASTNPALTDEGGPGVFRTCGRDDQQGEVAGDFLMTHFPDATVAFVHDKTAYGKGLADQTMANFERLGGTPAMYEAYTAGERDYSALVSKLKEAGVDVLYVGGYHTEAGLMARQMREQGMDTVLVSGDALVSQEYWAITGEAGAGTLFSFSPDPRKNPEAAPVVERFIELQLKPLVFPDRLPLTIAAFHVHGEPGRDTTYYCLEPHLTGPEEAALYDDVRNPLLYGEEEDEEGAERLLLEELRDRFGLRKKQVLDTRDESVLWGEPLDGLLRHPRTVDLERVNAYPVRAQPLGHFERQNEQGHLGIAITLVNAE